MAFENITSDDTNGKGVVGLPDTPQLDTTSMQKKFDELATDVIIPKFNKLVNDLNGSEGAGSTGVKVPEGLEADPNLQSVIQALHDDTQTRQPKEEGKGLSENDYTDEEKDKVLENTNSRHKHENKSVLDLITSLVKGGYDRLVTLFSEIESVSNKVTSNEKLIPTGKAIIDYVGYTDVRVRDVINELEEEVSENTHARHSHENKSVLDAITNVVKSGYDRVVTLFSSIKRVTTEIESSDEAIPTGKAVVDFVQHMGGGDMSAAKYDPDGDGKVTNAEMADNALTLCGKSPEYYENPCREDNWFHVHAESGGSDPPTSTYAGPYSVTPQTTVQVLETEGKAMSKNVTVNEVPRYEVSNGHGITVVIGGNEENGK